jgi:isochorismate synthase
MNLIDLKCFAIDLIEDGYRERLNSVSINIQILDLFKHIKYLQSGPICFIKEKNNNNEMLAHGAYDVVNDIKNVNLGDNQIFFGAEKFPTPNKKAGNSYFFKPIIIYNKKNHGHNIELKINLDYEVIKNKKDLGKFIIYISELLTFTNESNTKMPKISEVIEVPEIDDWKSKVNKVIDTITKKQKIVLSRQKIISYKNDINEASIIDNIPCKEGQYLFFLKPTNGEFFISVSPEKLFSLSGNKVVVDCIAGTRARGKTNNEDKLLEKELFNSEKERAEHLFVANFLEEKMNIFCDNLTMTKAFDILKLSKVQHLHSEFIGKLKHKSSVQDIINNIYPTPAIAGTPSDYAIENISEIEKMNRNYYAGACGYIGKQAAELLVGIRSIHIINNKIHIYGGAGIVSQSNYKTEWVETEEKMKNFSFLWEN